MPVAPLVTVLLAVHDGERYLGAAVASALGQTSSDLELLVVDDASTDRTPEILADVAEARLRVIRNDERLGLAGSLNRGLDEARGEYIARLDADDVALPRRLERQLARLRSSPRVGVLGSAVLEIDDGNRVGRLHQMPTGAGAVRWAALFSSPFFHPSVFVDRDLLERNGLRYDTSFEESEDYELWSRLLDVADGDNLPDPLVLYRVHAAQASQRRRELQRECQLRVARRRIAAVAPELSADEVELAWRVGSADAIDPGESEAAADAYLALLAAFERRDGAGARAQAARDVARVATHAAAGSRARLDRSSAAAGSRPAHSYAGAPPRPPQRCGDAPRSGGLVAPNLGRARALRSASQRSFPSRRRTGRRFSIASPPVRRST